jgi:hypothetical protein
MWLAGTFGGELGYSTNGTTWTKMVISGHSLSEYYGIEWNGKMWVAVGNSTGNRIAYSTDGFTWTGAGGALGPLSAVAWNGKLWVVGSYNDGFNRLVNLYSTNGTTWSIVGQFSPLDYNLNKISWNGQLFIGVGSTRSGGNISMFSKDGINWSGPSNGAGYSSGIGVAFNNARPNTITFPANSTAGLVAGTASQSSDITLSSGQAIEIVTDSYIPENTTNIYINIQA